MTSHVGAVAEPLVPGARSVRAAEIVREIAIGGLAGLFGGLVVVGIGGRIFMRVAAQIDPSSVGSLTSNGNRVGEITAGGTLGFVVFAGFLFGAYAAVLWVTVSPWLPGRGVIRALASGAVAVALGSFFVIRADERDFRVLDPPSASIAMLVVIVAVLGAVIALTDDRFGRRLPAIDPATPWVPGYLAVVVLGLLVAPVLISAYFMRGESASFRPPVEVGAPLVLVGIATVVWWTMRVWNGLGRPPAALVAVARIALFVAIIQGVLRLTAEASAILGSS
jgi:hypothetical protein